MISNGEMHLVYTISSRGKVDAQLVNYCVWTLDVSQSLGLSLRGVWHWDLGQPAHSLWLKLREYNWKIWGQGNTVCREKNKENQSQRERKNEEVRMSREVETKDRESPAPDGSVPSLCVLERPGFSMSRKAHQPPDNESTFILPTSSFLKLVLTGFCFLYSKKPTPIPIPTPTPDS